MQIAVINAAGLDDMDVALWTDACDRQFFDVCKTWGIPYTPVIFYRYPDQLPVASGRVRLLTIVKSLDIPGAEGVHQNYFGLIFSRVEAGDRTSVDMSHEIVEMGVNPFLDTWVKMPDGRGMAKEIADPVEADTYLENGHVGTTARPVPVSNYVLPSYFDLKGLPPYDRMSRVSAPFGVTPGGYYVAQDASGARSAVFAARELRRESRADKLVNG